jgi:nitrate reductase NapD
MSDHKRFHHISSAVVLARPDRVEAVSEALRRMARTEIHARRAERIVVVMEGSSADELGGRLAAIAAIDGVIAANMVFEHIGEVEVSEP